jgi:uncharacterized phage protein gp47/JayE
VPFKRPTLSELITRVRDGIFSRLSFEQLRRSDAEVYGKELAGTSHELHGHLQFIAQNAMYDTAIDEYLERHANIFLTVPRIAAEKAQGNVTFTGATGALILADTELIDVNGIEYLTDVDLTLVGGTGTVAVTAFVGSADSNKLAGDILSLILPIDEVSSSVTVAAGGLVGGADIEDYEKLRARLSTRLKTPPQGGAKHDYVTWALEVAGVTRAWVYPQELGDGTVTVRFVRDDDVSIIPDAGEVIDVFNYIDALKPVTADLFVVAPVAVPLNFTIAVTPNTALVKAAVEAELRDLLQREAEPGGTILLSHIRESISIAAGESNYVMTVPAADVTNTTGNISTFGAITWV